MANSSVGISVDWKGAKELLDNLSNLSRATQDKLAFQATAAAARVVRKSAQDNIQSYGLIESGALIGNVAFAKKKPEGTLFSYDIGVRHGTVKQIKQDDDPFYWFMLEFGTVKRPGTPFLSLAFDQEKSTSLETMRRVLAAGIERVLARGRR